ncbi:MULTISPECIES: cytochrome P450 [Streptomyces]|uniref:Cytochrome P450 n=1 Tax=Streptomyces venezuelae TaxID=54571 RepID=A0A5P2B219_STRVZ|nr:cytochrome P450 [Streptomyces venezuelae]QES22389.1 cytochrome P450 [Streptomyces venezuelae]
MQSQSVTDGLLPDFLDDSVVAAWAASGAPLVDLLRLARVPGRVTGFRRGGRAAVLITEPRHVHQVLGIGGDRFVKRSHRARPLIGDGVMTVTGEVWKSQRRLLQAMFTGRGIQRWERHIVAAADRVIARWAESARRGEPRDIAEDAQFFTVDTIWRSLTDHPLDQETYVDLSAVQDIVAALPADVGGSAALPPEVETALAALDERTHRAIAEARGRRETATTGTGTGPSVLDRLLDAAGSDPAYTDRLIRDELVTLLVAGYESSARTLAWAFVLLDRHPEAMERAAGDARAVEAVLAETLRLYPTGWLLPRHAPADETLDGLRIPAGTDLLVCPYLTHRDPEVWPDPEAFAPERFPARAPLPPGAYLPFGIGPRACLGTRFAMREMEALLGALLSRFTVETTGPVGEPVFGINLRPAGPLYARVRERR